RWLLRCRHCRKARAACARRMHAARHRPGGSCLQHALFLHRLLERRRAHVMASRRIVRIAWTACAAVGMGVAAAQAAEYPARPVRMVVPIGPGSSMDITARLLGQKLNELWERPVVMDNRPGAGSSVGAEVVARAAPDGYTILFGSSSMVIAPMVHRKPTFDTARDF